jgi:hypothetical protein
MNEALIFILQFVLLKQKPFPSVLWLAGNQPVLGVDDLMLPLGAPGLIPCLFQPLAP